MDLKVFEPHELGLVLRALRHVASANDAFTEAECDLIESLAAIHGMRVDATHLLPVDFADVARVVRDPHRRKRALQLAIVMALVEGEPSEKTERVVLEFGRALEISDEGVTVLREITHGHSQLARIDMFRRLGRVMRAVNGFPGFFKMALPMLGIAGADRRVAERYYALERCEEGTFGRAFHSHYLQNAFRFPGELGGIPEGMIFHDLGHVLSGYGVDPQGEIQQAAFQAGFLRNDGFSFLLFGILQFHLGLRVTPIAKGQRGLFDVGKVMRAAERGAACKLDLSEGFDVFAHANQPIDELRRELGIPPL